MGLLALRKLDIDWNITNPWSNHPIRLNLFKHKGYWYFGKDREYKTMILFSKVIGEGDTVLEIGGHIGYISQYFSQIAGNSGFVFVFEPGENNIPYIEYNISDFKNIFLVKKAISNKIGKQSFFEENIGGQNNSLIGNYQALDGIAKKNVVELERRERVVEVTTIDEFVSTHGLSPKFIKIDVEGGELGVLEGATNTLRTLPNLMVEVTHNRQQVAEILGEAGFALFDDEGRELTDLESALNVFATRDPGRFKKLASSEDRA
jgi:FkbM family methyltransferase